MKYVIYQRVSTDKQEVAMQQEECLNYIRRKENSNYFECKIFSDPDTSSRKKMGKRKGLQECLEFLKKGDCLVVYKLNRLARKVVEMVTIYEEIINKGCKIHSLNDPEVTPFIVGLMGVLAQEELKVISENTKAALRTKKNKNHRTGNVPYGFTVCPEALVPVKNRATGQIELKPGLLLPDPNEQVALTEMSACFASGMSYRGIAKTLKCRGYRNRAGKPFQHMSIFRILSRTDQTKSSDRLPVAREFEMFH